MPEAWQKGDQYDQYGPQWADFRRNQAAFKGGAGTEGQYYFRPGQTGAGSVMVGNAAGGRDVYDPAKNGPAPGFDDKRWTFEDQNGYGKSLGMDATKSANWTPSMRDQFTSNLGRTEELSAEDYDVWLKQQREAVRVPAPGAMQAMQYGGTPVDRSYVPPPSQRGVTRTTDANGMVTIRTSNVHPLRGTTPPAPPAAPPAPTGFAGVAPSGPTPPAQPTPPTQPGVAPAAAQGPPGGFGGVKPIGPRTGNGLRTSFGQAELR